MNKSTKVLVYSEAWGFGGIETYLMGLFRTLSFRDFSFTLLTTWDWNDSYDDELASLGVERFVVFKGHRPGQVRRLREGLSAFGRLLVERRFDAVHINTMNGMGFAYARLAASNGVPVRIVHSHNSDVGAGGRVVKRLVHLVARFALSGSETVRLACSEEAGRHLFGARRFTVARNGFDTAQFAFDPVARKACRDELGVPADVLLLGNPSRLAPAKNPLFQLDVFAEVLKIEPSAWYLMQGSGELERQVRQRADVLGVAGHVAWFEPRQDVASLYSAMDALLFPSLYEGQPLVPVEAQASGLPVLMSENVSRETVVTDLVRFERLDSPASQWGEEIVSMVREQRNRTRYAAEVHRAGYDVADTYEVLANYYQAKGAR